MPETEKAWMPIEVSNFDMALPAKVSHMMPEYKEIPRTFENQEKWERLVSEWFFCGVKNLNMTPREGIDKAKALRHIKTIMGSFEPQHEHKGAACAYLLSLWFTDATWERSTTT